MKLDIPYIVERMKEISTWRMLGAIAGAFGIAVSTGQVQVLFAAVTSAIALYEAFQPDAPKS